MYDSTVSAISYTPLRASVASRACFARSEPTRSLAHADQPHSHQRTPAAALPRLPLIASVFSWITLINSAFDDTNGAVKSAFAVDGQPAPPAAAPKTVRCQQ